MKFPKDFHSIRTTQIHLIQQQILRFDIPKSSIVKMIIYDALGKEVATLVNEKLSAGSYEVDWNAFGLSEWCVFL